METLRRVASFLFVGALWGCSNAFIKQTTALSPSSGLEYDKATVRPGEWGVKMGLASLVRRKAALAFLVNQTGSLVFYYLLGSCEISLAVPLCNSLTFVFTAITSYLLGERLDRPARASLGVFFVLVGVTLCVVSK